MKQIALMIGILTFLSTGCSRHKNTNQDDTRKMPKNLAEAINYLNVNWSAANKLKFKSEPEEDATANYHFGAGLWIRNNWIYGKRDSALVRYFNKLGVYAPDDISGIILLSFHRILNKEPIELNEQVSASQAY